MKTFNNLGLAPHIAKVLPILGYETPTPIQHESIPVLLKGGDLLAQAQTGTGKTAAFALPILSQLDLSLNQPQALILAPTRELAIQVAEAFQQYAKFCPGFHVLPIYGGQEYGGQLKALKRGVHVVVGTPGRVMDHLRKKTLVLNEITTIILDEADEMLKMGFIDDVKWILEQIPHRHQTALFSATMPVSIKRIADQYLKKATLIQTKPTENSVKNIQQYFTVVGREHKMETLTRFLAMEEFTAAIIFTRTKIDSTELSDRLEARGYAVAAINGDMTQALREKVIQRLKQGSIDIIVATEVAARGLDIDRISFVINYDVPYDADSYTHRIGRTGRAGRTGKALVFVTPREMRMLKEIQRVTKQTIKEVKSPSLIEVEEQQLKKYAEKISAVIVREDLNYYRDFIKNIAAEGGWTELEVAAAMAFMSQEKKIKAKETSLTSQKEPRKEGRRERFQDNRRSDNKPKNRGGDFSRDRNRNRKRG